MALARHRKAMRAELETVTAHARSLHIASLSRVIDRYGLRQTFKSAENLAVLLVSLSQALVFEAELGISHNHGVHELIESMAGAAGRSKGVELRRAGELGTRDRLAMG